MSGSDAIQAGEASEGAGNFLDAAAAYHSATTDPSPLIAADAHFHLGRVNWKQGRLDAAVTSYEQARTIAMDVGAIELRARAENGLGAIHHARGAYSQAKAAYAVALDLTQDTTQRGRVLLNLGAVANVEGDLEKAQTYYDRSRAAFRQTGFVRGEASALHNVGMLNADQGRWDEADEAYRECLELLERLHDRQGIASVLVNRSELSCANDDFDEAIARCDLALSIFDDLGDEMGRGEALRWKGRALRCSMRFAEADGILSDAIRIARRSQAKLLEAEASWDLGLSRHGQGDSMGARKALDRAAGIFEELGAQRELADVRSDLNMLDADG